MKRHLHHLSRHAACLLWLACAGLTTSPALAGTLHALAGDSATPQPATLLTIDPNTGAGTAIGRIGLPADDVGLALDPEAGVAYAVGDGQSNLLAISTTTGVGRIVGPLGFQAGDAAATFDPCAGVLWLVEEVQDALYRVETATGRATRIGPLGIDTTNPGLAFDPWNDVLYGVSLVRTQNHGLLFTIDTATGAATITHSSVPGRLSGLALDPDTNTLYASASNGGAGTGSSLYVVDRLNGTSSFVGGIGFDNVEGLAVQYKPKSVPGCCPLTACDLVVGPGRVRGGLTTASTVLGVPVSSRADGGGVDRLADELGGLRPDVAALERRVDDALLAIDDVRGFVLRLHVERELAGRDPEGRGHVASFVLPASLGGHLELSRSVVVETIANADAAGLDTDGARRELDRADEHVTKGEWTRAWDRLAKAYRRALNGRHGP